jgi:hypothetical protein
MLRSHIAMKRFITQAMAFFAATAYAQAPLAPISPEVPVSDPVITAATFDQYAPQIATNGDISLAVWSDYRDGVFVRTEVSRIAADGAPLDPFGIEIASTSDFKAVVWNGSAFVVVFSKSFVFVTPNLTITTKSILRMPEGATFAAVTPGADPRFLFLKAGSALVVDGAANIVSTVPADWGDKFVAGASESGFLVIHQPAGGVVAAERLDRDGRLIARNNALPVAFINGVESIAGGADGFVFVQRLTDRSITAHLLDDNGVYKARADLAPPQNIPLGPSPTPRMAVVRESDRYLVVWQDYSAQLTDMLAEVRPDGSANVRALTEWPVTGGAGIAIASSLGRRLIASAIYRLHSPSLADVYVRALTPTLTAEDPQLVTQSATVQASAQVASGANGFAVVWTEGGVGQTLDIFLRRFSLSGQAQGSPPLVGNVLIPSDAIGDDVRNLPGAKIASSGDSYVVGWQRPQQDFVIRRMVAATGAWIDAEPVPLPKHVAATLASDGHDAVAVTIDACATGSADRCLFATRISMSGDLGALAPATAIQVAERSLGPAVASDGTSYLVAWTNPLWYCAFPGCSAPQAIYALRLRADATAINPSPVTLGPPAYGHLNNINLQLQGDRYLLSWSDTGRVAFQVSTEAAVLSQAGFYDTIPGCCYVGAPLGRNFALFFPAGTSIADARWESALVPINANRIDILTAPHTKFLPIVPMPFFPSFVVASRGTTLAVVYNHISGDETGRAQRLYFRLFAVPTPARTRPVNPY